MRSDRVSGVTGKITTADGVTTEFQIDHEGGWAQWGGDTEDHGATRDAIEAMAEALGEHLSETDERER